MKKIKGFVNKIKGSVKKVWKWLGKNLSDISILVGFFLVYRALYCINHNLGNIVMGITLVACGFGIYALEQKEKAKEKREQLNKYGE